jgi:hypothetical protein
MPVTIPAQVERKRRIHKKSRKGCANCKLRGVKVSINDQLVMGSADERSVR